MKTPRTKTLTIDGKRYRVSERSYDDYLTLKGPGSALVGGRTLPTGVTLDSPDLRKQVIAAIERAKQNHAAAVESLRQNAPEFFRHDKPE